MPRFLAILAPFLALTCIYGAAAPARAEAYPVCLAGGSANTLECDYATLAQCEATATGGLGYCVTSPGYAVNAYARYRGADRRTH